MRYHKYLKFNMVQLNLTFLIYKVSLLLFSLLLKCFHYPPSPTNQKSRNPLCFSWCLILKDTDAYLMDNVEEQRERRNTQVFSACVNFSTIIFVIKKSYAKSQNQNARILPKVCILRDTKMRPLEK